MAKRRKKGHKGKKKGHRKNPNRVRAAKRVAARMKRLGKGIFAHRGRKRRKGKKSRKRSRGKKRKSRRSHGGHSMAYYAAYQKLINRGRHPAVAHKIAARLERMSAKSRKRAIAAQMKSEAGQRSLANLFANIGTAGRVAHLHG